MSAYSIQPDIKHVRKSGYEVFFFSYMITCFAS